MPNVMVGNGQMLTTAQTIASGENVFVANGGSIMVANGVAIAASGNTDMMIAGDVYSGGGFAAISAASSRITVMATGSVQAAGGHSAILMSLGMVQNLGYIGALSTSYYAVKFNNINPLNGNVISNIGTIAGKVALGQGTDIYTHFGGSVLGVVEGEGGNDTFNIEAITRNTPLLKLDGGAGADAVAFLNFASAVWVDLDYAGAEAWSRDDMNLLSSNPWRELADLSFIENVTGGLGWDYLSGNSQNNVFGMSGGRDDILGDGGSDTFDAGTQTAAIWVDLQFTASEVWTQDQASGVNLAGFAWREVANLVSVENLIGTPGGDYFAGDGNHNTFAASSTFTIGTPQDVFIAGLGIDTYDAGLSQYAVWIDLAPAGTEVWTQRLSVVNSSGNPWYAMADLSAVESIIGSAFGDFLAGDGGANRIEGRRGPDTITGRGGSDTFAFSVFSSNYQPLEQSSQRDTITDFAPGVDKIQIYGGGSVPVLVIGSSPTPGTFSPTLLYNTTSGVLSFDVDGADVALARDLAILTGAPLLTTADFTLLV